VANHIPFFDPRTFTYDEEAAVQAAMRASMQEQQATQQCRRSPPASQRVMRSLPQICVSPEDLINENNRECCICLEAHQLHERALRLPCAHIFHPPCIEHWLQSSCTCPVCRYELPTDDAVYEAGRVQRMKERKPRFARHELDRLPVKQLLQLRKDTNYQVIDRRDLIDHLIESESIEIISAPEPVEYSLSDLRTMTVSQLRRCMNEEAGVFFDPKDVIEKEDMIRIFLMSGRLLVLPEEGEEEENVVESEVRGAPDDEIQNIEDDEGSKPTAVSRAPVVETVTKQEDSETAIDERTNPSIVMEESEHYPGSSNDDVEQQRVEKNGVESVPNEHVQNILEEEELANRNSLTEESDNRVDDIPAVAQVDDSTRGHDAESRIESQQDHCVNSGILNETSQPIDNDATGTAGVEGTTEAPTTPVTHLAESSSETKPFMPMDMESTFQTRTSSATHSDLSFHSFEEVDSSSNEQNSCTDDDSRRGRKRPLRQRSSDVGSSDSTSGGSEHMNSQFDNLSIHELKTKGEEMSIDLADCIERHEIIRRLSCGESVASTARSSNNTTDEAIELTLLDDLSVTEICKVARLVEIDLNGAITRQDIINAISHDTVERPHAGRLFRALVPFVGLSVSQLCAAAREMQISLSGCIEKDDILSRIVKSKMAAR